MIQAHPKVLEFAKTYRLINSPQPRQPNNDSYEHGSKGESLQTKKRQGDTTSNEDQNASDSSQINKRQRYTYSDDSDSENYDEECNLVDMLENWPNGIKEQIDTAIRCYIAHNQKQVESKEVYTKHENIFRTNFTQFVNQRYLDLSSDSST